MLANTKSVATLFTLILFLGGCSASTSTSNGTETPTPTPTATPTSLTLTSDDITDAGTIHSRHVMTGCGDADAQNVHPHLKWSNPPSGTKSFALTTIDVGEAAGSPPTDANPADDHPAFTDASPSIHWIFINIPAGESEVERNGLANSKYIGPCPPPKHTHRYKFQVHALSVSNLTDTSENPDFKADDNDEDMLAHIRKYALETATIEGKYTGK